MNCLICKADIINPVQQFGDVKRPLCQSHYLAGYGWVYENKEIIAYLERGFSLSEACEFVVRKEQTELEKFAEGLLRELVLFRRTILIQ